ncbi:MAG: tryptophan synthase subunit alpha [Thermoanaerobaculia bacterium]|nr:MAG: tryptophan synthase subunit alpha [Thermoanaerobaculia bacterium]
MRRLRRERGAIARAFERARKEKRAAFVPFLMAGDPDLATTTDLVVALAEAGADVVELGVPFSDPMADGPVNQAAAERALAAGTTLERILATVASLRARTDVAIVLFSYFNPIHRYGVARLAEHAAASGVDGILCVDLPPDEAQGDYLDALRTHALDPIFLLAPTSTRERVRAVARVASGFVYYVSRTGVTGERAELPRDLAKEVTALRKALKLPVAVGFGISTPQQAAAVARIADGVVVGSALVRLAAESRKPAEAVRRTGRSLRASMLRVR